MFRKISNSKNIAIMCFVILLVSLIPILYISQFAHPKADDYQYAKTVHDVIVNGGGVLEVIFAGLEMVKEVYFIWQGTFSAIFIFSLHPAVFSDCYYFLTTYIMVGLLCFSTFYLFYTLIHKNLNGKVSYAVILSSATLFMSIQFVPDIQEAFFWFNGSSYYTLFYSLSLLLLSLVFQIVHKGKSDIWVTVLCVLLSFIIGGGNYTTGLLTIEIVFLVLIYCIKNKTAKKETLIIFSVLFISFVISMAAPGNKMRGAYYEKQSPIVAIFSSLWYAFFKIGEWTSLQQIVYLAFITPIIFCISKKVEFDFKYPLVAMLLAFGLFSSQLTPSLYAMGEIGSGRQIDIYYYSYYLLMIFITFYLSGWINKKYPQLIDFDSFERVLHNHFLSIIFVLLCLWTTGAARYPISEMTAVKIVVSIFDGSVKEYEKEYQQLFAKLMDKNCEVVRTKDLPDNPSYLGNLRLTDNPSYWTNTTLADYYSKELIVLETDSNE